MLPVKRVTHHPSIMAGTCRVLWRSNLSETKIQGDETCPNSSLSVLTERKRPTGSF
ncbi:hypothetical protein AGR1B_Cc90110 [Agrobacterium fabacearum S56]|nr:hypothetical protein AGR1B_Cc90110 [Agrobacterium fabacearum S56]